METKATIGLVRFSYAHVFEPAAAKGSDKLKYSVSLLIPKSDTKLVVKVKELINAAVALGKVEKWGGKIPTVNFKNPLRDGDVERGDDPVYQGHYFISASSDKKPGVVDRNVQPILDRDDFYSGCYGFANVNFYPFNNISNGVACGLNHVQKTKDGDPLGSGGVSVESAFEVQADSNDTDIFS